METSRYKDDDQCSKANLRLTIVDDHEIFLKGLEKLLLPIPDIEVVARFMNGHALLSDLLDLHIDLLVLDLQLPDIEAEALLIEIKKLRPALPILYLTMMRGNRIYRKLEKHGIGGYILKDASMEELCQAIRLVGNGQHYTSTEIDLNTDIVLNTATMPKTKLRALISPREYEVLVLICQEYSSSAIAQKLYVSTSTVNTHRKKLLAKIGVTNTVGLVKYAIKHGILSQEDL